MVTKKIFYYEESPYHPGYYLIRAKHEENHINYTEGSFNILPARLLGLTYANYLRMCRDIFGATLIGKNEKYPVAYFKLSEQLFTLVKVLNTAATAAIFELENPEYEMHKKEIDEYEERKAKLLKLNKDSESDI